MSTESPSSSTDELVYITSKRGGQILLNDGRKYHKGKLFRTGSQYWTCANYKICSGSLTVYENRVTASVLHHNSCTRNPPKNIVLKEFDQLRNNVTKNYLPIPKQYNESICRLKNAGMHLLEPLPKFANIHTGLYNARKKFQEIEKSVFRNHAEVQIPVNFRPFILAEYEDNNKILLFASKEARLLMTKCKKYFADGTFGCCQPFDQLYVIYGDLGSDDESTNIIPLVYALLLNKKQLTYEILFHMVKSQIPEWEADQFTFDFEIAPRNAIKKIFPNIMVRGCYFHFYQSLMRKARLLGIKKTSKVNNRHVCLCAGLAILPIENIEEGWIYIQSESPNNTKVTEFNKYMYRTWIKNKEYRKIWCCHQEQHRTTNYAEGWNSRMKRFVGRTYPTLPHLLSVLHDDAIFYGVSMSKFNKNFHSKRKTLNDIQVNIRINRAVSQLENHSITTGHCLEKICPFI